MKTKHLLGALLSFLCTIIFFSCGNNNEEKRFFVKFGGTSSIVNK